MSVPVAEHDAADMSDEDIVVVISALTAELGRVPGRPRLAKRCPGVGSPRLGRLLKEYREDPDRSPTPLRPVDDESDLSGHLDEGARFDAGTDSGHMTGHVAGGDRSEPGTPIGHMTDLTGQGDRAGVPDMTGHMTGHVDPASAGQIEGVTADDLPGHPERAGQDQTVTPDMTGQGDRMVTGQSSVTMTGHVPAESGHPARSEPGTPIGHMTDDSPGVTGHVTDARSGGDRSEPGTDSEHMTGHNGQGDRSDLTDMTGQGDRSGGHVARGFGRLMEAVSHRVETGQQTGHRDKAAETADMNWSQVIGLLVMAAPAFLSVWSGWIGLGEMTGWSGRNLLPGIAPDGGWATFDTSIFLGLGVEMYGSMSLAVFLKYRSVRGPLRWYALSSALLSLGLGALGQISFHVLSATHQQPGAVLTGFVAVLPVLELGAAAGLLHLVLGQRAGKENPR